MRPELFSLSCGLFSQTSPSFPGIARVIQITACFPGSVRTLLPKGLACDKIFFDEKMQWKYRLDTLNITIFEENIFYISELYR